MPMEIEGATYYTASELTRELRIVRQTLWRWRERGQVPKGRRYRGRQIVFTEAEAQVIREFAHRMEPVDSGMPNQLGLFNGLR